MCENRERLDVLLVKKGLFSSRERARESVLKGEIFVNGLKVMKCGKKIDVNSKIDFKGEKLKYVSRGGLKLEKAVEYYDINLKNKVCFDIGASKGGFTDCMLQNGASKVWAIDVGSNQLDDKLKKHEKVTSLEKTNVRYLEFKDIGQYGDFASIDVSFISLEKIIPNVLELLHENAELAALIKPQFEAGKSKIGKHGVVKKPEIHVEVIERIIKFLKLHNLKIIGVTNSPIKGPEGNIEYLVYCTKDQNREEKFSFSEIIPLVRNAHKGLK
ncbi:TlyA family RNA methyltransferase [Haloimpatiens sp. FM7330]|uniref:TlyA family RNA methyltransferase n=1 Tax=Haloimpatiens sp. FM7330 TaxID=3298610 RepID=UPI00362C225E